MSGRAVNQPEQGSQDQVDEEDGDSAHQNFPATSTSQCLSVAYSISDTYSKEATGPTWPSST